ncbi:uncharacterized protein LOC118510480 [Anopheles stephensi]|uniref:uncharacterized protein LOC118510480 n=1 Tax=Anopheles stephensi TaxID=30069 RepID=UPI001658802B|nr:uncharacterized protein LOC118510480 [Anopheles stephensi]
MSSSVSVLLSSLLLMVCRQTNAVECIDMEVYSNEVFSCCRYEPFCNREASDKCSSELNPQLPTGSPDYTVCYVECVHRAMGYISDDGAVEVAKYVQFLERYDKGYQMVVGSAVKYCASIQDDIRRDVELMETKCNAFALLFHVCVAQLTLKSCPADRWLKGEICDKVKMGITPCN